MKIGVKNIKIAAAGIIVSAAVLLSGCAGKEAQSMADYIGIDAAQEAALAEAGISASDADFSVSGLDSRDGTFFYEVRFSSGDKEYEYAVDALTGVVIEEVIKPLGGEENKDGSKEAPEEAAKETAGRTEVAEGQEGSPASGKAGAGSGASAAQGQSESVPAITRDPSSSERGYIGLSGSNRPSWEGSLNEEEAKQIALSDAGVSEDDIAFIRIEKDRDDGIAVYDVEFMTNDFSEYDYEINAENGEIRAMDQDMEHHYEHYRGGNDQSGGQNSGAGSGNGSQGDGSAAGSGNGAANGQGGNGYGGELISEEDAKAKVLERVPGAAASDIWMKLERDDGRLEYEGELYHDGMEYEFKIDAYSGSVTEWESERR